VTLIRAILGALCGYLIFALTGVALGLLSGRNMHAAQPLWFVVLTAAYGVLFAGLLMAPSAYLVPPTGPCARRLTRGSGRIVAGSVLVIYALRSRPAVR
jgi:RsiW-degrading membrane proteinase PrsW (M82 family)